MDEFIKILKMIENNTTVETLKECIEFCEGLNEMYDYNDISLKELEKELIKLFN